jgi:hypothetical protein
MATGYEVAMYRDIERIRKALESIDKTLGRIALALELQLKDEQD